MHLHCFGASPKFQEARKGTAARRHLEPHVQQVIWVEFCSELDVKEQKPLPQLDGLDCRAISKPAKRSADGTK